MPFGLDGNPNPVRSAERDDVLTGLLERIRQVPADRVVVGVDGAPGAGKSTIATELAGRLRSPGRTVVRSTTDSFHQSRSDRYQRGPSSAPGYYEDSHDLDALRTQLLDPFKLGAATVQTSAFDEPTDAVLEEFASDLPRTATLIFDGLFLQRLELAGYFDVMIYLRAEHRRADGWLAYLLTDLPDDVVEKAAEIDRRLSRARWPRYRDGWHIYVDSVEPHVHADVTVDNTDFAAPKIVQAEAR